MNFNFTDSTRKALAQARDEALRLGHDYVGTEHILLGIVRDERNLASRILAGLGHPATQVRAEVERRTRPGLASGHVELPYTSRAKKSLELAMAEAKRVGDGKVDPAHLLLGLFREEKGLAAAALKALGVGFAEFDAAARRERAGAAGDAEEDGPRGAGRRPASARSGEAEDAGRPVWFLELDPKSDAPIYEQIVARVKEAVATGRLAPGERLPTVRELADELGLAPGTVARAYSELEKGGVIETAGAKGTFVAERPGGTGEGGFAELEGLLRPVAIAAFHLGATADQLRAALDRAMKGILRSIVLP